MVTLTRPTLTLAEVRERQQLEQAALAALGLSGRADETPKDVRRLAVVVNDLVGQVGRKQRP